MTDRDALFLSAFIGSCWIWQVADDEWELAFRGRPLEDEEDPIELFGGDLMVDDLSDTKWFYSVDDALSHLLELEIKCSIEVFPLWSQDIFLQT
jgi:hypothetical protein